MSDQEPLRPENPWQRPDVRATLARHYREMGDADIVVTYLASLYDLSDMAEGHAPVNSSAIRKLADELGGKLIPELVTYSGDGKEVEKEYRLVQVDPDNGVFDRTSPIEVGAIVGNEVISVNPAFTEEQLRIVERQQQELNDFGTYVL